MTAPQPAAGFGFLRAWTASTSWPPLAVDTLISLGLHLGLLTLIIQRRDLSDLDHFVLLYLLFNLSLEALRLLWMIPSCG